MQCPRRPEHRLVRCIGLPPKEKRLSNFGIAFAAHFSDCAPHLEYLPIVQIWLQHRWHAELAVCCLIILDNRYQCTSQAHCRAIESVYHLERAISPADADAEVARLEVGAVAAASQLAVGTINGRPVLDVVLLGSWCTEVSRRDIDHMIRLCQISSSSARIFSCI